MYSMVKNAHVFFVVASGAFFVVRGLWALMDSPILSSKWVRILPHINDTLLLCFAVALMAMLGQYPIVDSWLTAKVIGLLLYIAFGTLAIKRGKTKQIQVISFALALFCYGYMISVAITKQPEGFLGWLL